MSKTTFDAKSRVWRGAEVPSIFNSNVSLGYLVLKVLQSTPDAVTQVSADTGSEVTCYEMYQRTVKIASYLMEKGFKKGDVAGNIAGNSEHIAAVAFACLTLGLPINSLAPKMDESEITHMFGNTRPKLIFADAQNVKKVQATIAEIPLNCVIFTVDAKVDGYKFIGDIANRDYNVNEFAFPDLKDISDLPAFILSSSGTTAKPKAIFNSHKKLIEELMPIWKSEIPTQEVWFSFATLHWVSAVFVMFLATLYGSKRVITTRGFCPKLMIEIIQRHRVTTTLTAPALLALTLKTDVIEPLESLKIMIVVGSVVSRDLCKAAKRFLPNGEVCTMYGSSEGNLLSMSYSNCKYGSAGNLYSNVQMKILDNDGKQLGVNEIGEIAYKTPQRFLGYFNEPELTAEAIRDGWVLSGDLGYFDDEGYLFVVDRKKDLFFYNCCNISPSEIEAVVNDIDGVLNSCVVGVYQENEGNDLICAFVIKKPSCVLCEDDIASHVNSLVRDEQKLRGGVHFVDSFPMTMSGKIKRFEVKKMAKEKLSSLKVSSDFLLNIINQC